MLGVAQASMGDAGPINVYLYGNLDALMKAGVAGGDQVGARQRYTQGSVAEAGEGRIVIYMPNFRKDRENEKVVIHEYYHLLQGYLAGSPLPTEPFNQVPEGGPVWLLEGTAEYFAYKLADERGFTKYQTARRFSARITKSLPALDKYETWDGADSTQPPNSLYDIGMLAAELLDTRYGSDRAKYMYWRALEDSTDWQTAFVSSFGVPVSDFYRAFEEFRRTL